MKSKQETFASLIESSTHRYELRSVFDDFLTMSMCAVTQIPGAGKSHYEDLYVETAAKYKDDKFRPDFPKLFARLIIEMESRLSDSRGNDVLGDYYELHFCRKNSGQFFTPWPICKFMANAICGESKASEEVKRILDPCCGSGRMLLASAKVMGWRHEYYGIDIDHTCVKMTALNLFLNGIFHSEVMWGNALSPSDFRMSYAISFLPLGIFRIEDMERSKLLRIHRNSFPSKQHMLQQDIVLPSEESAISGQGSQLQLF